MAIQAKNAIDMQVSNNAQQKEAEVRVLVLGATGFLGSNTVSTLLHHGHEVVAYCRRSRKSEILSANGVEVVEGDLFDLESFDLSLKSVDWLIHLASTTSPSDSLLNPENETANLKASRYVFAKAVEEGVAKILYSSSGGTLYGTAPRLPVKETQPTDPMLPYARNKLAIENELCRICDKSKTRYVILRYGNPYGPNQYPSRGTGVVTAWLEAARNEAPIYLFGDGEISRDYLFVSDAVSATLASLEARNASGIYNIGTGVSTTLDSLLNLVHEVTGRKLVVVRVSQRPSDSVKAIALDSSKALADFDWRPIVVLREGIAETWNWVVDGEPFLMGQDQRS